MGGNRNQIVLFAQHLEHLVANVQAKQASALDKKPHLVFAMGVLVQELFPQRLFLRVIGAQADDVPALVALFGDQFINRMLIGGNHRFRAGICAEVAVGLPALETDAFGVKLILNRFGVGAVPDRRLRIGHGKKS